MHKQTSSTTSINEEDFSYSPNLSKIQKDPINSCTVLEWHQLSNLQGYLYPGTKNLKRNVLIVPYLPQNAMPEHTHDYFEIVYVVSGSCSHHVEKSYSMLYEGDLCILPPGISHYLLNTENARLMMVFVNTNTLKSLFSTLSTGQDLLSIFLHDFICKEKLTYYLLYHTENNPVILDLLLSLKDEMLRDDEYSDHLALAKLSEFLLNVTRLCKKAEFSSGEVIASQDQQILSMIYEQYATITLAQLAEALHYSVPYCSKYLKKNMGCTFSELIQRIRFQQARNLLINSTLPVNQIGKNIGYETPENFFRAFKKVYGMTPSQYRKTKGGLEEQTDTTVDEMSL